MQREWQDFLRIIAEPASPTDEQVTSLISGWDAYFDRCKITDPIEQGKELRKMLSIRIKATGDISILAPEPEEE